MANSEESSLFGGCALICAFGLCCICCCGFTIGWEKVSQPFRSIAKPETANDWVAPPPRKPIAPTTPTKELFAAHDDFDDVVTKFEKQRRETADKLVVSLSSVTSKLGQAKSLPALRTLAVEFEASWKLTTDSATDLKQWLWISEDRAKIMFDKWERNNVYANPQTQQIETNRLNTAKKQWEQLSQTAKSDVAKLDLQIIAGRDLQKRLVSAYLSRDIEVKVAEFDLVLGSSKEIFEHLQKFTEKSNALVPNSLSRW